MGEIWLFFIKKINRFNKILVNYIGLLFKNIIYGGKNISKMSFKTMERKKMEWEMKQNKEQLGDYIYKSNTTDKTVDFSNDTYFHEMIKKIRENKSFLGSEKNKINKIEN